MINRSLWTCIQLDNTLDVKRYIILSVASGTLIKKFCTWVDTIGPDLATNSSLSDIFALAVVFAH